MAAQGRGKQSKGSEAGASPIPAHPEDTSRHHTPSCEEIRLRAYEIYLERGSFPGSEVDDWLQAEHELDGRAPQKRESADRDDDQP